MPLKFRHRFLLIIFIFLAGFRPAFAHPYHTSIGEVQYNSKTQKLEIAIKVFTDDLEKSLVGLAGKAVTITGSQENKVLVSAYVKKYFAVENAGKPVELRFVGFEPDGDTHWIYLEVAARPELLQKLIIRHQLLMETFEDQMNILNLEIAGRKQTMLFKQNDYRKAVSL